jgi:uncharacterized membrane protein
MAMYHMLDPDAFEEARLMSLGLLLRNNTWLTAAIVGAIAALGLTRFASQRPFVKVAYYILLGSYFLFYVIVAFAVFRLSSRICIIIS